MDRLFQHPWAKAAAFILIVVVAVFGVIGVSRRAAHDTTAALNRQQNHIALLLYKNSLGSCQRGIGIRQELNAQNVAQIKQNKILIAFLSTASKTRAKAYLTSHQSFDLAASVEYALSAQALRDQNKSAFKPFPIPLCSKVIARP